MSERGHFVILILATICQFGVPPTIYAIVQKDIVGSIYEHTTCELVGANSTHATWSFNDNNNIHHLVELPAGAYQLGQKESCYYKEKAPDTTLVLGTDSHVGGNIALYIVCAFPVNVVFFGIVLWIYNNKCKKENVIDAVDLERGKN